MDKQNYRDAIKSKNSLQVYMDALYGKGVGHVDTFFNKDLDTLLVIKVQPESATKNPKKGYLPIRHLVYSSKGRGFYKDVLVLYNGENKSELAKKYLGSFIDEYGEGSQCQAWSL